MERLMTVSLAELPQRLWASVYYCHGTKYYGFVRFITRHIYPTREAAFHAKAWIDQYACGGGCTGWHAVERALPLELVNHRYRIERKDYRGYGGTIPNIFLLPSD